MGSFLTASSFWFCRTLVAWTEEVSEGEFVKLKNELAAGVEVRSRRGPFRQVQVFGSVGPL